MRIRSLGILVIILPLALFAAGQNWLEEMTFEEWPEKQAEKLLEKSSWTKTYASPAHQNEAAELKALAEDLLIPIRNDPDCPKCTSEENLEVLRLPSSDKSPPTVNLDSGVPEGWEAADMRTATAVGRSANPIIYFRAHWLSARPVRMAFANRALRLNRRLDPAKLRRYAGRQFKDAVVSLTLDGNRDAGSILPGYTFAMQQLYMAKVDRHTRLLTKSGKEVKLQGFIPSQGDGTGAKFIFPRKLPDGRPLLESGDKEVRFQTRLPMGRRNIRLNLKFKIEDMYFKGKLEY